MFVTRAAVVVVVASFAGTLPQVRTRRIGLHLIRNVMHFAGQNLWFFALTTVPLSQLFAFEFSTPLWVAVLAPFFFLGLWVDELPGGEPAL